MPTAPGFVPITAGSAQRPRVSGTFLMMAAQDLHQAGQLAEAEVLPEVARSSVSEPTPAEEPT